MNATGELPAEGAALRVTRFVADSEALSARARVPFKAVPRRKYGQMVTAVVAIAAVAMLFIAIWQNPHINHGAVTKYLTVKPIMDGLITTIKLTVIAGIVGWCVGVVVAVMRMSSNRVLRVLSWFYIWFFRGTPLLVQLLFWGYFALLFRNLVIGVPFTDIWLVKVDTNTAITAFVASILGLGLNEGAYMAEIVRGGILAVDKGQTEAAAALGMTPAQNMRRVVLPQALRVIIPPTGNQFINLLKATSLVSVIAGGDLLTKAQNIAAVNFQTVELLIVATFWYFVIVSLANVGQHVLERRAARGHR